MMLYVIQIWIFFHHSCQSIKGNVRKYTLSNICFTTEIVTASTQNADRHIFQPTIYIEYGWPSSSEAVFTEPPWETVTDQDTGRGACGFIENKSRSWHEHTFHITGPLCGESDSQIHYLQGLPHKRLIGINHKFVEADMIMKNSDGNWFYTNSNLQYANMQYLILPEVAKLTGNGEARHPITFLQRSPSPQEIKHTWVNCSLFKYDIIIFGNVLISRSVDDWRSGLFPIHCY